MTDLPEFLALLSSDPALRACYHATRAALENHFRGNAQALPRALGVFVLGVLEANGAGENELARLRASHDIPGLAETDNGFACIGCGNCCRPSGYVRLQEGEADAIAAHLGLPPETFIRTQTRLTSDRRHLSLPENPDGSCPFLTPDNLCRIHPVKPSQCRGYPWLWRDSVLDPLCAARCALSATL